MPPSRLNEKRNFDVVSIGDLEIVNRVGEDIPMPPKEQKVTLIMEGHNLSAFELGQRREVGLEHSADHVA